MKLHLMLATIFLLVLLATAAGLFYQTPGSPFEYTTVRGEQAKFQGSGLYSYDPAGYVHEAVIWDAINLFIGLPLFTLAIYASWRGSLRGRLFLGGLLFYFYYVYLMAMAANSFNPLFLVYTAIFALSGVAWFLNLSDIDVGNLPARISSQFPRRVFIGFVFMVAAILTLLWTGRIIAIMLTNRFPPEYAGITTPVTQGIDLGLVVPLMISTGILLWRRSPWGHLLCSTSLGYGLMMFISLPAFAVTPLILDGTTHLVEAIPFLSLSLVGLIMTALFYRSVHEEDNPEIVAAARAQAG